MSTQPENKSLGQKAADLAVQEAKSQAFWFTIGKVPALIALVWGAWVAIPVLNAPIPNPTNKAGFGEYACLTNHGLITSIDKQYMQRNCPDGYEFRQFEKSGK